MSCTSIADLLADVIDYASDQIGTTASYYPAVLTGYDETATERDPSEDTVVSVTGIFTNLKQTAPDGVISRSATFTFPYSADLGFQPSSMDRLVIGAYSYRAVAVLVEQIGGTVSSYTLTLEQS